MSPEQRREMVVRAALPLVAEYGSKVTTAQIARAAGIGEATIFRVFPDKEALLDACIAETLDATHVLRELGSISLDQPVAARLAEAGAAMRAHLDRMGAVVGALHASGHHRHRLHTGRRSPDAGATGAPDLGSAGTPATGTAGAPDAGAPDAGARAVAGAAGGEAPGGAGTETSGGAAPGGAGGVGAGRFDRAASFLAVRDAIAELLEPDQATLRLPATQLADLFMRLLITPRRHPAGERPTFDLDGLIDVFLHGALRTEAGGAAIAKIGTSGRKA
jgi:AcrR family transcriptional regulator